MAMNISNAFAALWFLYFCCLNGFAMDLKEDVSKKYIEYFSLERIKKIVEKDEIILRAAFPEEASSGWHYRAEDPVTIFTDIQTALKATIENKKPSEVQVDEWVLDYIAFFIKPVSHESTTNFSMSAYNVLRYSHLSDKCPEWLRPELEKWAETYQPLYKRLEKVRLSLDYYNKRDYLAQIAYKLTREQGYHLLDELVTEITELLPSDASKKAKAEYLAQFIIVELGKHFKLPNINPKNYEHVLIDDSLACELRRDKTNYFIYKKHNSFCPMAKKEYVLNEALLRKLIVDWLTTLPHPSKVRLLFYFDE